MEIEKTRTPPRARAGRLGARRTRRIRRIRRISTGQVTLWAR